MERSEGSVAKLLHANALAWARTAAIAVAVSLIGAAAVIRLNDHARSYSDDEARISNLEGRTVDAHAAAWTSLLTAYEAQFAQGRPEAAAESRAAFGRSVGSLEAGDATLPPAIEASRLAYTRDLRAAQALLEGGRLEEARAAIGGAEPAYTGFRQTLVGEREVAAQNERRFQQIGTWGTVVTTVLAGGFIGLLSWHTERTRRKAADATAIQLRELAYTDSLTSLPNRAQFMERLAFTLARASEREHALAVLFLDLDNFKTVNDTMGHAAGDELIALTADRIRSAVRPTDVAARLGGDEFAIIIDAIGDVEHAVLITERIMSAMEQPFFIEDKELAVRCSVGIATTDCGEEQADELMRNADVAMYVAKSRGKSRFEIYEPSMHPELVAQRDLLDDLSHALERGELENYYQPLVDLGTGSIVGAEALLRWNHPTRRLVLPGTFIPLAEESGLIVPMGRWVLQEACRHVALWRIRFPERGALTMHVNVSAAQLGDPGFLGDLSAALRDYNVDPPSLTVELTESMMIQEGDAAPLLRQIRDLGVRIAIDDFGTGYSSLGYLQQFPVDEIKIDRSFTERLGGDGPNYEVTRSIVELGRSLNLDIVAEGIEHESQVAAFRLLGCTHGQGYYYAKPMPAAEFARALSRDRQRPLVRAA